MDESGEEPEIPEAEPLEALDPLDAEGVPALVDVRDQLDNDWALRGTGRIEVDGEAWPAIGPYALMGILGRGGMGVVYYGVDPRDDTEVAVKILPRDIETRRPELVQRFVREARLAARLHSDNMVRVIAVDRDPATQVHYMAQEYVRGKSAGEWLDQVVSGGGVGLPEIDALEIAAAATRGLAAAHAADIVHRDVKPDNILLPEDDDGYLYLAGAKLTDLGLARPAESSQTRTGTVLGTMGYAPMEQIQDLRLAKKPADVFSMGATLYALLTGRAPFQGANATAAILNTMKGDYRPVRSHRPDAGPLTCSVVDRCLKTLPEERFTDAQELLVALESCLEAAYSALPEPATLDCEITDVTMVVDPIPDEEDDEFVPGEVAIRRPVTTGILSFTGGIPGTEIRLAAKDGGRRDYRATVDSSGRVVLPDVEEGSYHVVALHPRFRLVESDVFVVPGGSTVVQLEMSRN